MRILHITDCYLPQLGGIEMHVSDLARRQLEAGHEVTVLTRAQAAGELPEQGVQIVRLPAGGNSWRAGRRAREVARERDVDVVHAHLSVVSPLAVSALRSMADVPTAATIHSVVPDSPMALRTAAKIGRLASPSVAFTAVSDVAAAPWRRAMGDRMPIRILSNGIDPSAWRIAHEPGDGRTFTVVTVGRLARRKRQRSVVRMLAQLRDELPTDITLRAAIIGDGDLHETLRADVDRHDLADIVALPGAMSRCAIREVLSRADVYVAPAVLESFGIAALEARCAGVPVVGMSRSGVVEFVRDGVEGLLADGDDQMLAAVRRLALDADLRSAIHAHNLSTLPPMAWPLVLAQHEQVYLRVRQRVDSATRVRPLGSVLTSSRR